MLPVVTASGSPVALGTGRYRRDGRPTDAKSENARLSSWIYVDLRGRDLKSAVDEMQNGWRRRCYCRRAYLSLVGQFEYLERATATLKIVLPVTLMIIFILLWLTFRRISNVLIIMGTLPFALIGGVWLLWLLEYNLSVAGPLALSPFPGWQQNSA